MKFFGLLTLSVLLICTSASIGTAQEGPPPTSGTLAETARSQRITGSVTAVDGAAKTITVKTKKEEMTFHISDKTKIVAGKEDKKFSDLKNGDNITALAYDEGGKLVAESIRISTSKASDDSK